MSSHHEAKYYKTALCVRGSLRASDSFACVGASTASVGNSETLRLTQYQFRVFKNMDCFMSLHRRYLNKASMLLFRNSAMQR